MHPSFFVLFSSFCRDYAAAWGTARSVGEDLGIEEKEWEDLLYAVYLDNNNADIPDGQSRYLIGVLLDDTQQDMKEKLLSLNSDVCTLAADTCEDQFHQENYQVGYLPSVKATAVQFPFSNGLFSTLLLSFKVWKNFFILCRLFYYQ